MQRGSLRQGRKFKRMKLRAGYGFVRWAAKEELPVRPRYTGISSELLFLTVLVLHAACPVHMTMRQFIGSSLANSIDSDGKMQVKPG